MARNKEVNGTMKHLESLGFTFVRRTKHCFLYKHPEHGRIGVPTSPGDVRGLKNFDRQLARLMESAS